MGQATPATMEDVGRHIQAAVEAVEDGDITKACESLYEASELISQPVNSDFIPDSTLRIHLNALEKYYLLARAMEAGLIKHDPVQLSNLADKAATSLAYLAKNHRMEAIQKGSIANKLDLPRIFSNATGDEATGRPDLTEV